MNAEKIRNLVEREVELAGGMHALARKWDVTASYICQVVGGKCNAGPKILKQLGLRRVVKVTIVAVV